MSVEVLTDENFKDTLTNNRKVVVKYFANWCGSCKLFSPKYRRMSEDTKFEGVKFVDVNAEENPEARKMAGVDNLPYFAVFKNGTLLGGASTNKKDAVAELIEKLN